MSAGGRRDGRRAAVLLAVALALGASAGASEWRLDGFLAARGVATESTRPWIEGGFGRYTVGGDRPGERVGAFVGKAQLGVEWGLTDWIRLRGHGLARYEGEDSLGDAFGLTEGFLEIEPPLSDTTSLRFRAGLFFPGTSRENVGPLWDSPYTITLSALNSWTAEELRLLGVESRLVVATEGGHDFDVAFTVFGGADPAGSLLSWRGWAMGDRLSVVGESLPLPPLDSLARDGSFRDQRADGTLPIDELDERPGFLGLARWSRFERATLQAAYVDTRGDKGLWRGQYSWRTRFAVVGGDLYFGRDVVLVGEFLWGDTAMGDPAFPNVDVDMRAAYALASWTTDRTRLTVRWDYFEVRDRDGTEEPNDDRGQAWTAAFFWTPSEWLRFGLEYVDIDADERLAAIAAGADGDTDGRRATLEVRVGF